MADENWIVTGANRGIGLELVKQLTGRGTPVIATARHPESAAELRATNARVEALDVTDAESVAAFARSVGAAPVDVLVNNAGAMERAGELGSIDYATMQRQFDVNTLGPLRVTEALLPALERGTRRVVASITSKMGSIGDNSSGGSYSYRTSKTALNMVNKSLALDLGSEGFACLVLHPGWVRTDMGGGNAPLAVEESARGLLSVIDGAGRAQNGQFINFDGSALPW